MLGRFVLSRKYDRSKWHVQLIVGEFMHQWSSDSGFSVISLDAHLKRQRLVLLLQFMRAASNASDRN
ncbi:hypothetical protein Plhal304r1_c080g0165771 [Plasmopara halstedii]